MSKYGPSFRWVSFRLYGDPPTKKWLPMRVIQIFGGQNWSISLVRLGEVREEA